MRVHRRGIGRNEAVVRRALPAPAHFLPQLAEQPGDVVAVREQRDVPGLFAAAHRIAAGEQRAERRARCSRRAELGLDLRLPVAAAAVRRAHQADDFERMGARLGDHAHRRAVRLRDEAECHRLEVHEQCIRADVVRTQRLVVERARVVRALLEHRSVEHEVAVQVADAALAHVAHEEPELLEGELRIAGALEDQVAGQRAVLERADRVHLCLPAVRRAERVERDVGRQQLDERGGVERRVGVQRERRRGGPQRLHPERNRRLRDARSAQRLGHRARQRGLGGPGRRGRQGRAHGETEAAGETQHGRHSKDACLRRGAGAKRTRFSALSS